MTDLRGLLAGNIKKRRKSLGLSQAMLAEKASTSPHYIAQIEQRKKFPSSEMLERIATALDFDSPELFASKTFRDEVINMVQKCVYNDLETVKNIIFERLAELKKYNN
jgi:transcriptional regulator with XRE-family HTH domain